MAKKPANDPFAAIRKARTDASNCDMDTDAIIRHLAKWQSLCSFTVSGATRDTVEIEFATLPKDMDAFVRDLYEFCPDLVDQGCGCVDEAAAGMEASGEELPAGMEDLIKGVDLEDENYGLEVLKRELQKKKSVKLWWD